VAAESARPRQPAASQGREAALAFAGLLALVFLAHGRSLGGWFLSDAFEVNLLLRDGRLDLERLLSDFTSPWLGLHGHQAWRPLVSLHYAFDWTFFGPVAFGYHLGNVLAHALASLLLLVSIRLLLPSRGWIVALVAAALFALHPARAEAVTWIAGRVSSTAGCLALSSLALGIGAWRRRSGSLRAGSAALFAAALFAKEESASLPFVLLCALLVAEGEEGLRARGRAALRLVAPHFSLLVLYLLARGLVLGSSPGAGAAAAGFVATLPGKLRALFFPFRPGLPPPLRIFAAAELLVPVAALFLLLRRPSWRIVLACALALAACLAPTFPVAVHPNLSGARTLYLASVPVSLLLAWLLPAPDRRGGFRRGFALLVGEAALVASPLRLLVEEQVRWEAAEHDARDFVRAVRRFAEEVARGRPIALFNFPTDREGIAVLDTNTVECALQRPYLDRDLPVLNLIQCVLDRDRLDAAPLAAVGEATPLVVGWDPARRDLAAYPPLSGEDREFEVPAEGIRFQGGRGRLEWTLGGLDPRKSAALEVLVRAEGAVSASARWFGARGATDRFDRAALAEVGLRDGARRFWLAVGNHVGWYLRGLTEGGIAKLELEFEGVGIEVREARLLGRLDRLEIPVLQGEDVAAAGWAVPFVPPEPGPYRLAWISPGETGSFFFDAEEARDGRLQLDGYAREVLGLLPRFSHDTSVHYFIEALGRRGAVHAATARSPLGRFTVRPTS
jgi:hypothetical protein